MAVNPTGAIFKTLEFDGVSSRTYGIYITGDAVYDAPARDVEMVTIPGRNGSFAQDNGRFENITVTYPAGIYADTEEDYAEAVSEFRNFLCSRRGYCRLEDDYNPDEYRMAIYKSGLEVDTKQLKAGQFSLEFECKPQRFLKSGEEVVTIDDSWRDVETETGDIVEVNNPVGDLFVKNITADFEPKQDGTPWQSPAESVPYLFRQSSGGVVEHDYFNELDNIVGGTVAWNQLVQNGNFADGSTGWSVRNATGTLENGYYHITDGTSDYPQARSPKVNHIKDHIELLGVVVEGDASDTPIGINNGAGVNIMLRTVGTSKEVVTKLFKATNTVSDNTAILSNVQTAQFKVYSFANYDLTQMFGSTIADYIYSLEQTTAGAGVAWLKSHGFCTKDYYAYDAGSLKSVKTSEHRTTGFNQWDEEWRNGFYNSTTGEYQSNNNYVANKNDIKVFPNTQYYINVPSGKGWVLFFYDNAGNFISRTTLYKTSPEVITTPQNCYILKFFCDTNYGTTYNHDICINISKTTGSPKNGDYVAYDGRSYPLDSDLELRGPFKLDANNNLYAEGDIYQPSGEVSRRYTIVDLGTLDWMKGTTSSETYGDYSYFRAKSSPAKADNYNFICSQYETVRTYRDALYNGQISVYNTNSAGWIWFAIRDDAYSESDATAFKTAMSGVYLVYELATPTTEQADPFTSPQIVDPSGTEEYVDTRDVPIPVGHRTNYAEIYPIIGVDEVDVFVSPTTSEQDATVYTADLNGTRYGGEINLTTGVLKTCPYYSSYNGETLTGEWLSDRDVYAAGTTPSIGAQVVNIGGSRTTTQLTTTEVAFLVGPNNVWADTGEITLEYGRKGNVLGNPTRFDASPLLEIEGYGTISLNGYEIELDDDLVGEVTVSTPSNIRPFPYAVTFPNVYVLPNDSITLAGPSFRAAYMSKSTQTNITSVEVSSWSGDTSTAPTVSAGGHSLAFTARFDDPITFNYGVASEKKITFNIRVVQGGSSYHISNIICSVAYDGDKTITFDTNVKETSRFTVSSCYASAGTNNVITINSTATTYGHPTYIDCDLGEAYADDDGVISSLNSYIALGSQLPVLSPGANEVAYDNTILSLKIQPRWWKI